MRKLSLLLLAASAWTFPQPGRAAEPSAAETAAQPTPATKPADLFPDTAVAKGKNFEIKRSQLDDAVTSIKATAVARGQQIPPEQLVMMEQQVLERLIQIQLLLAKATDADKAKGQETSVKRFDNVKTRAGSDEALNRQLKSVGMTQEQLRAKMLEEATAEAVLERELKINVSDEEVKKFYEENPARFEQPEMVRVNHILLMTRNSTNNTELTETQKTAKHKEMEGILKRARDGEDFTKLAREYSEDAASKEKGGEYTFPRGQMVPEFEAAAFSLNTNQVSDIVTTQFGYHIIKLSEKIPARKTELAKVNQDIKDYLKGQAVQKELPQYMEKVKKEAGVEIVDAKLRPVGSVLDALPAGQPQKKPSDK